MKKQILFLFMLSVFFQSCKTERKSKPESHDLPKSKVMDITSYTGNAVAFLSVYRGSAQNITFIPVLEKDSDKFKEADIFKLIQGRCSIVLHVGDYLRNVLLNSKEKKVLDREICNVDKFEYYVKIWISYKNYEERSYDRKYKLTTDSCSRRYLIPSPNENDFLEFKVLTNTK